MKIAKLREYGLKIGRKGLSEAAISAVEDFDGSYKGVMKLCGQLSVIAKCATYDEYWSEKVCDGEQSMNNAIEFAMKGGE